MEFKINDVFYHTTSGSLSKVIYQVNYHFIESASGTGADSGSTYYASQQHSTSPLDPVSSASFVAYDDITESFDRPDNILLEQGDGDIIILDGTDSDSTNAGHALLFESSEEIVSPIALETTNRIMSEGQIPLENWTLNSRTSPVGGQPIVHSSEILVRTTGDIALEDATNSLSDGFLVLNGTDSTSSNAGDNFDLEGATGITI